MKEVKGNCGGDRLVTRKNGGIKEQWTAEKQRRRWKVESRVLGIQERK